MSAACIKCGDRLTAQDMRDALCPACFTAFESFGNARQVQVQLRGPEGHPMPWVDRTRPDVMVLLDEWLEVSP